MWQAPSHDFVGDEHAAAVTLHALRVASPHGFGVFWVDFPDQWDPKSPWRDKRVRLAASLAIDRAALNQASST